ncbi:MAG: sulfatase-like hydrolase/transferase [Myxococcota bacterium]|jgi:arylsulfatase A-like enzyme/tetratricopeptide (TPR) repeat protein|nr:sulfatase-like hydrolase/transferase [Myxococcota bacterium]
MRYAALAALTFVLIACSESPSQTASDRAGESEAPATPARALKPNLVIVTLDTTRADALGAYGQGFPTSPVFDRMAREGVLFEDVTTSSPETLPSHASIFTGKHPFAHGVRGNAGYVLSGDHLTLAEVLTTAGYVTHAEVAAAVMQSSTRIAQGFAGVRDTESDGVRLKAVFRERDGEVKAEVVMARDGADVSDSGIRFLQERGDEPFFLWLHYFDAHAPYSPPPAFVKRIPESTYHAEVAYQDEQLGRFIAELEARGLRDDTLVIVTSDHGEGLLEHGERTHSYFLYESTVRIPLLFWGLEGLPAGKRVSSLVRNVDIAPTALDLLGQYPLDDIDGVSLTPLIRDEAEDLSVTAYGEASRITSTFNIAPLRYVREGRWKYIHKVGPEVYDVVADPRELVNRVEREPEVAAKLRTRLEEVLRGAPTRQADSVVTITPQVEAQLRALGYVEMQGDAPLTSERESLDLFGEDPVTKTQDMDLAGFAVGAVVAKKYAEAMQWVEPLWLRNPNSHLAASLMAETLVGLERWEEVVPVVTKSLEMNEFNHAARERMVMALDAIGRYEEAITHLQFLNDHRPCNEPTMGMLNEMLHRLRRFEEQYEMLRSDAERCPAVLPHLNNYAWALATLPQAELRDGAKSIRIMRQAIADLGRRDPAFLDTLAAGLAEAGRYEEAERVQLEVLDALKSAGAPEAVIRDFELHLDAYRSKLPLRDPAV